MHRQRHGMEHHRYCGGDDKELVFFEILHALESKMML
jgi:hypothetical protein